MSEKLSEQIRKSLDADTLSFPIDEWADDVDALESSLAQAEKRAEITESDMAKAAFFSVLAAERNYLRACLTKTQADAEELRDVLEVCREIMDEALRQDADEVPDWLDTLLGKLSLTMAALPTHLRASK